MADKDDILIDEIEAAFRSAYRRFRRADPIEQDKMFKDLQKAATEWVQAQKKLVEDDELATQAMIDQMRKIKDEIDDAANTQELVIALGRLVAFLAAM